MKDSAYLRVLDEAVALMEGLEVPYAIIGGIASVVLGRPRWPRGREDVDFFVRPEESGMVLEAFADAGFETERENDQWIFKAKRDDVVIDIIFRSTGDIFLDDEMISRIETREFEGRKLKIIPPEDLLVMKAVAHGEETFTYWHDALGLIAHADLDWDYLIERARHHGARRILSLLLYAQSNDLVVPNDAVDRLFGLLHEERSEESGAGRS